MKRILPAIVTGSALLFANILSAQVQFGIKFGANYLIASQSISPTPKDEPPTPKGLGLQFGGYAKIPFSDLVGLRPELGFSFRRAKSDQTITEKENLTDQNGTQVGTADVTTEVQKDQKLQYFEVSLPLTITPSSNFRLMLGPSISFLMGGKLNQDVTVTEKGSYTLPGQPTQEYAPDPTFTSTSKKGSAATKDFKKAEVALVVGGGYELEMGLDFDLRYYRAIIPTQEIIQSAYHYKAFANMVEFSVGYTFGN